MKDSIISRRYASALFGLGRENGSFADYKRDLLEFSRFYHENADFRNVISNPLFRLDNRKRILEYVLERSDFALPVNNFLRLLLDKDRMGSIESITDCYSVLTDQMMNIAHAEIVTARPLKRETVNMLERSLEELTSKEITMDIKEDQGLIGGIVVRIGDLVLDGSVRGQLKGLKESFKRGV